MESRTVIKLLKADGWQQVKKKTGSSHMQFKHGSKPGRVTVPHPVKHIPLGTLKNIERQSGIKFT
jgi:predicted RNA binding protein YcfA (HicA-like mRNA interferase family)